MGTEENGLLASWKEISAYLGVDKRTCARWEKALGLPVHRLEGAPRSRVFAYKEEMDGWRRKRLNGHEAEDRPAGKRGLFRLAVILPAAVIVIGSALLLIAVLGADRVPANFRISGSSLIVLNEGGRELWRFDSGLDNFEGEARYRIHSFARVPYSGRIGGYTMPWLKFKDIDGDGRVEVLFSTHTENQFGEGDLYCFDARGRRRWRFRGGRAMTFGDAAFSPDYRIEAVDAEDFDNDGKLEVFVISDHNNDFPSLLTLLDCQGRTRGEFWNSGRYSDYLLRDINGDGRREILVSGVNNEYREGYFMVLDASRIGGGSPQMDRRYASPDVGPGSELCYVRVPRSDLAELKQPVEAIVEIAVLGDNRIQLFTDPGALYFTLGFDLKPTGIRSSHHFEQARADAVRAGKLKGPADEAYFEALERGLLYWNGREWTGTPSWSAPGLP